MIRGEGSLERLAWRQRPGVGRDSDPNETKTAGPGAPGSARSGVPVNARSLRRREPSQR